MVTLFVSNWEEWEWALIGIENILQWMKLEVKELKSVFIDYFKRDWFIELQN